MSAFLIPSDIHIRQQLLLLFKIALPSTVFCPPPFHFRHKTRKLALYIYFSTQNWILDEKLIKNFSTPPKRPIHPLHFTLPFPSYFFFRTNVRSLLLFAIEFLLSTKGTHSIRLNFVFPTQTKALRFVHRSFFSHTHIHSHPFTRQTKYDEQ